MNSQMIDDHQATGSDWTTVVLGRADDLTQETLIVTDQISAVRSLANLEDQMAFFEREHQSAVAELARNYIFSHETSVKDFLKSHRAIPQLLISALPHLRHHLGHIVFSLRAVSDEYGWQLMYVDALWSGKAADAFAAIDHFEDEWWIANSSPAAGSLIFTYRLV